MDAHKKLQLVRTICQDFNTTYPASLIHVTVDEEEFNKTQAVYANANLKGSDSFIDSVNINFSEGYFVALETIANKYEAKLSFNNTGRIFWIRSKLGGV